MTNLYKIFIRPNFEYGNTALITAENVLTFALSLTRNTNNDIARKCANTPAINKRIKQLTKSWYGKSMIKNSNINEYIAIACHNTPLAYTIN